MTLPLSLLPRDQQGIVGNPNDEDANDLYGYDGTQELGDGLLDEAGEEPGLSDHNVETREETGDEDPLALHAIAEADAQPTEDELGEEPDIPSGSISDPMARKALETMYSAEFPLLKEQPNEGDWTAYAKALWNKHGSAVTPRLHSVERNRLMRKGIQWISSQGAYGPWREPPKPKESTRAVDNRIGPALDQRVQIIAEQKPGFRTKPQPGNTTDKRTLKRAEAQQIALEYQYDAQNFSAFQREAAYWTGTDGVAFWLAFWNPDKGPWDETAFPDTDHNGQPLRQPQKPMGDMDTKTLRIEQVRVSANASATATPTYWIVREVIPTVEAVKQYGEKVADVTDDSTTYSDLNSGMPAWRPGVTSTQPDALYRDQPTVEKLTVFLDRSEFLPTGLTFVAVGNVLAIQPMPLPFGCVPLVRVTDGSTDPNWYPEPIMDGWIDAQMRINALKSKWIDSIRVNAGGRFLGRENAIATETFMGGQTSIISVKGPGALGDSIMPVQGFSIGQDVKDLLELEIKSFEDKSGYNDQSRGSFEGDPSGRAILAQREALERIFAPPVNAMAEAMERWAEITLAGMRWGYDYPRTLSMVGSGRPDLAKVISQDDLDGVANVTIDPETMMPMPRALRLFLLDSWLERQLITPDQYKERAPFAFVQNIESPDVDQTARAYRVVQAIKDSGNPMALPVLWQDNEAIHQNILERELILPDDPQEIPDQIRQAAMQRWTMLAQQAQQKMGPMPQPGAAPAGGGGGAAHHGPPPQLPPGQQPFMSTNPSVPAADAGTMGTPGIMPHAA